jgi:hypothetical protein
MDEKTSANICRCCLSSATTFKNMLPGVNMIKIPKLETKILDFFLIFSGISGSKLITAKICKKCEIKLSEACEFRELIIQSDISLSQGFYSDIKEGEHLLTTIYYSITIP